jgi:hypothetical protein
MARLVAAYAPVKLHTHRTRRQLLHPWVLGWRYNPFMHYGLRYADIDLERRARDVK